MSGERWRFDGMEKDAELEKPKAISVRPPVPCCFQLSPREGYCQTDLKGQREVRRGRVTAAVG